MVVTSHPQCWKQSTRPVPSNCGSMHALSLVMALLFCFARNMCSDDARAVLLGYTCPPKSPNSRPKSLWGPSASLSSGCTVAEAGSPGLPPPGLCLWEKVHHISKLPRVSTGHVICVFARRLARSVASVKWLDLSGLVSSSF